MQGPVSGNHFFVDGTLIEAGATVKSFRLKEEGGPGDDGGAGPVARNDERTFCGEKRSNVVHASTTDSDMRLGIGADGLFVPRSASVWRAR